MKAINALRPDIDILFVADQAHVPYGSRPLEEVREFAIGITNFLLNEGVKLVVVACNTASAAALHELREIFPDTPFVGMEPAVKPAVNSSSSHTIGVLATPATFQGKLYASVIERFAHDAKVLTSTCPGLVEQIEAGNLNGSETISILQSALTPMLDAGADSIVLGCTHYPFVSDQIQSIVGEDVKILDPSPAIARNVDRMLPKKNDIQQSTGSIRVFTTGNLAKLTELLPCLLGSIPPVSQLKWHDGALARNVVRKNP